MTIEKLEQLRQSNEAPFNHQQFAVWLHNKILEDIKYDLWNFRERESSQFKSTYALCTNLFNLPSLKTIE